MADMSGGRAVIEMLKAEGVTYIFGIVGSTFLDVLDALYDDRSVEYINVRHEQAGAFMADGLARVTGRPGVCLVTSGPGATNLLTGVAALRTPGPQTASATPGVPVARAKPSAMNAAACSSRARTWRGWPARCRASYSGVSCPPG